MRSRDAHHWRNCCLDVSIQAPTATVIGHKQGQRASEQFIQLILIEALSPRETSIGRLARLDQGLVQYASATPPATRSHPASPTSARHRGAADEIGSAVLARRSITFHRAGNWSIHRLALSSTPSRLGDKGQRAASCLCSGRRSLANSDACHTSLARLSKHAFSCPPRGLIACMRPSQR